MTSYVTPKKNTAYKFYVALVDQSNTKLTKANPTIASGDFKVSTDGGAFANLATLPSANPASGRAVMIDLSAGEMNGDNIVVQCVDAAGAEWCDLVINIQTTARQIDDLAYPATSGRSMVVDANGLVDANVVKVGPTGSGTAQTARDIGASVLLSSGTGTGQLNFTAGVVQSDAAKINGVATSSVTTISANVGTTQPINFTGAGASALAKSDMVDIAGAAVATGTAQIGVNVVNFGGSAGTFASGRPAVNTTHIAGTATVVPGATGGLPTVIHAGTAQAASTTVIRLAAGFTGDPTGMSIVISSSAGIENRIVDSYDSVNLDATVEPGFAATPSGTVTYELRHLGARVATQLETDLTAIKAKTDLLDFDAGNSVSANIHHVNDIPVAGSGTAGSPWGP